MNPTPLWQELAKSGVQALVVVVGLVAGWGLLRRQERIKRQEELWAGMRKLRANALVKCLEAIGRFHTAKVRRVLFEERASSIIPDEIEALRAQESEAHRLATDARAHQQFLLPGPLAVLLGECSVAIGEAKSKEELAEATRRLHSALEAWIPPLRPHTKP